MRVPLRYAKVKSKETCSLGRSQRNGLFRALFTGYPKGYPRGHPAHQTQGICIHFQLALGADSWLPFERCETVHISKRMWRCKPGSPRKKARCYR